MAAGAEADVEALLVETRRRAGRINHYVDLIPARYFFSSEALQAYKPRSSLDPAQYKPTSQLLSELLTSANAGASAGSSSSSKKKKKEKKQGGAAAAAPAEPSASSRAELREKLERRIGELKDERRRKQSEADREKTAARQAAAATNGVAKDKRPRGEATASPAPKKQRSEAKAAGSIGEDVEAGRLSFEPRISELPFEASVNRRGNKIKQLRSNLRKEESKIRKLSEAEVNGDRESLRGEYALNTALRRAKGEKVHDDVTRLRKAQKQLEVRKSKGKDKWESRVQHNIQASEEKQQKRKDNLQNRRKGGTKKGAKGREGFEGKGASYLNSEQ